MATRIKLKRSTTPLATPTTSDLLDGEVALNIADRKLYARSGANVIEVANYVPNTGTVTTDMLATDLTNGPGQTYYVAKTGSDSTTLGNGGANGKHQDTPFLTIAKALTTATSGDKIIIGPGTYTEVFPLTVPDGVAIQGSGIRATKVQPTSGTKTQNGFVLNGDTHVSDLTIGGIEYLAGSDRGYAFTCANNWDSTRSAYVERVTVLNKGSVTSPSDPFGYAQGDAGRGAKLDASIASSATYEPAVLFNECTFFTPNQVGLYMTNGIRVELLNSFFYFASEAIKGVSGATGVSGAGKTRLKLGGVSGTFSTGEDIYELTNNFVTGTYSQTGTSVTITSNNHGFVNGDKVYADYTTGSAVDGFFTVSSAATNTFVLTAAASATTTGNVQFKKATAYGTVASNDGTYVYLTNKGTGEFSSSISNAKTAVITGDAKLSTAQYKFGTASLTLDGTGDYISYVTDPNFGFGLGDFTIECFARFNVVNASQGIFEFRAAAGSEVAPLLYLNASGRLVYQVGATGVITGGNTLSSNTWYHIAVSRTGNQTKLFLNGTQEGSTYTDNNDYGSTKQLQIGTLRNAGYNFNGFIDEVRISKGTGRYTANFTAPAAAFVEDLYTVLLLHLDGANNSTTILDSSGSTKDIRSSGGDSASAITLADYTDFGAELRSIGCAAVYGNKGVVADGLGVVLRLTAVNFEYIGTGFDISNNSSGVIQGNEVTELNGGRIYYSSQDQSGNFRVGDLFVVDQELGNVTFSSVSQNAQAAASITLSDGTGTTNLYPAYIETGNLRLSGNTLSSNSGQIILDPSANEDIVLNAEVISPEELFFDTNKIAGISSEQEGNVSFNIAGAEQGGYSTYGFYSNKNLTVYNVGIDEASIDVEGSGYESGINTYTVVTNPINSATATVSLDTTNGSVKTISLSSPGIDYTVSPTVSIAAPPSPGLAAAATANLKTYGRIAKVDISNPGSGYTSPTVVFSNPPSFTFSVLSSVNSTSDSITIINHPFENGDQVVYSTEGGTQSIGLTNGNTYYVINATTNTFKLSLTSGGAAINLTASTTPENHSIRGKTATGTVSQSGGSITGVTFTYRGAGYQGSVTTTINDPNGTSALLNAVIGYKINTITITQGGDGYTSNPSVTITPSLGDTTGNGASASSSLGYPIGSVNLLSQGSGYSTTPVIILQGGSATTEAILTPTFSKKTGKITSLAITDPGENYSSAPTVVFAGGSGADAEIEVTTLPFAGTITTSGSGYKAGTYNTVTLLGGSATTPATATITVPGLSGTVSGGSGYANGIYPGVPLRNTPTTTYTVTSQSRTVLSYRYNATDDYEWNIVNNGTATYGFTRVSPTGTASGNNISITAEVGDILTFNVNAVGHPFWIQTSSGAYDALTVVTSDITNNGTFSGTLVWDTKNVAPGTYYYVCQNHQVMGGTITISAYSGGTFSVGNTITGTTSGASGTVTYVGKNYIRFATVTGGPFSNSEVISNGSGVSATTLAAGAQQTSYALLIDGTESPSLNLKTHNTYKFVRSDASNNGTSFSFTGLDPSTFQITTIGTAGQSGAYIEFVIKDTAALSSNIITYGPSISGGYINVSSGSSTPGVYGTGASGNFTISGGSITAFSFADQGSKYKIGDVLLVDDSTVGNGGGSNFSYTITSNNTGISSITNISTSGGLYAIGDILTVNPNFDTQGAGNGFQFTVSKVGYVSDVSTINPGFGYALNQNLIVLNKPSTSGTEFELSVNSVVENIPIEIQYDGGITALNWSIDTDGNTSLGSGTLQAGATSTSSINNSGTLTSNSVSTSTLTANSSATVSNLTANGITAIKSADIELQNGSDAAPSLQFSNSTSTGLFRQAADVIGVTIAGTEKGRFGSSNWYLGSNFNVDSVVGATTPFFTVDQANEVVKIGDGQTQLRINNDASIQAIGSNTNVGIRFEPKGTGSFTITGASNRSFLINDGLVNTFTVDTFTGNTAISGKLQINSELQLEDNVISNIDQVSTVSFGQITSVTATGTATGYTTGTYTAVTSTTNGIGTGATFNVTVAGGDITAIAVNSGGRNYKEGDTITLNTVTIGSGSGKTILVSDVAGAGISIKPQTNKNVRIDTTASLIVPSGTTNERPVSGDRFAGAIRFNTTQLQFEGYNGNDFVSLGGVRDVDQNTYLLTELSPGSNENTFFFYNDGVNSLDITQNEIKLYTARTIRTTTLTINNSSSPLDVQYAGTSVLRVRSQRDVEISNGLRLKYVPQLGAIATIGTVNAVITGYTPSSTFTGVATTSDGEGTGATFNVTTDASGNINSVTINASGSKYAVGDKITIAGNLVGGTTPAKDVSFLVATISGAAAAYSRLDTLTSDFRLTLNSGKEFISFDQGVSNAGLKINQNYAAGGASSYLTVLDSTAAFVELNDVRVEGSAISNFSTSSSIVQFVKTTYKGAKTLITIESDDNKVQMLEVTSICASNGTTPYATITNSITSHNDLVDAAVNVSGNNIVISLTKSAAATSSTSFTGRYTTTKVKA
jgi:plastocyanin